MCSGIRSIMSGSTTLVRTDMRRSSRATEATLLELRSFQSPAHLSLKESGLYVPLSPSFVRWRVQGG